MADSLDKLTIRGFKSIREMQNFELKKLNVFVGANGAGKSNLISFFRLLQSLIGGTLSDYVAGSGGISDLLLDQFSIEEVVVVNRKEGQSTFERLQKSSFNEWLEDYSVGELWTKNVTQGARLMSKSVPDRGDS